MGHRHMQNEGYVELGHTITGRLPTLVLCCRGSWEGEGVVGGREGGGGGGVGWGEEGGGWGV